MQPLLILGTVAWIIAAIAFGFHYKYIALWISFVAIFFFGAALFVWFHALLSEHDESPHVSVAIEIWMHKERDNGQFSYVVDGGRKTISPINDLIYVRLKNEDETKPLMIDYFALEISKSGKRWIKATLIDDPNGVTYFKESLTDPATTYKQVSFTQGTLKENVFEKNIGPKVTVKGWLFVDRPEGFDQSPKWRLRVKNPDHIESTANIDQKSATRNETFGGGIIKMIHSHVDLSDAKLCYFSERDKLKW